MESRALLQAHPTRKDDMLDTPTTSELVPGATDIETIDIETTERGHRPHRLPGPVREQYPHLS